MRNKENRLAQGTLVMLLLSLVSWAALHAQAQQPPGTSAGENWKPPVIYYISGLPVTFATHTELAGYGFSFGPSDGLFGAIPAGGTNYTFYGTAGSTTSCAGTPKVRGAFTFSGTLDHVNGSNGCRRLFGPGDGPRGWVFDKNYAGGGQVVRFAGGGKIGWLMPFHGEVW